jgi:hypothetical protein
MDNNKQVLTGVKKRQQIKNANQMTFIWIMIASAAVVFCLVTAQFLVRQAWFNQKVINERAKTQSTLANNIKNYDKLKKSVEKLVADPNLAKVKANESDTAYKVVLDALPVTKDGTVLGSSLLQVILPKSGVSVTSLSAGDESTTAPVENGENFITFDFAANSSFDQVAVMLRDLERSIRPISVTDITLQGSDKSLNVQVRGQSYYEPEQTITLGKKVVQP